MLPALVVTDMQNYYLLPASSFFGLNEAFQRGSMDYLSSRATKKVIPNIQRLLELFRRRGWPVVYLRLCSQKEDRADLHRHFRESHVMALEVGVSDLYPLCDDTMADVIEPLRPQDGEIVLDKTTYSAFTSTSINALLRNLGVDTVVMTGLATSQCVDTTARDASDYGFEVLQVHDAQADYTKEAHVQALLSSSAVCGPPLSTDDVLAQLQQP